MLESLANAQIGTIAFLSSLMREFIAFMMIPVLVKYLNTFAAIGAAGATSEDSTLPMLIKYSSEEFIIISVINGVLCSVAVPILINFFFPHYKINKKAVTLRNSLCYSFFVQHLLKLNKSI